MNDERRAEFARGLRHVDRSIRLRVRIYVLIFLGLTVLVAVEAVRAGRAGVLPVLVSLTAGVLVGVVASRMFSLSWDRVSGKVIGRLDALGALILLGYVLLSLHRQDLLGLWFSGPVLAAAGPAMLAGVIAGQVLGTSRGVRRVFRLVTARAPAAAQPAEAPDTAPVDVAAPRGS